MLLMVRWSLELSSVLFFSLAYIKTATWLSKCMFTTQNQLNLAGNASLQVCLKHPVNCPRLPSQIDWSFERSFNTCIYFFNIR